MTPKEKAKDLVHKIKWNTLTTHRVAKQCALIAVDEMIIQNGEIYLNSLGDKAICFYKAKNAYLFEVKTEIKKL